MFAASRGEVVLVAFIFALVWGAGVLPRLAGEFAARSRAKRLGGRPIDRR
jgi:Sec-independent protein translocase protein TatA